MICGWREITEKYLIHLKSYEIAKSLGEIKRASRIGRCLFGVYDSEGKLLEPLKQVSCGMYEIQTARYAPMVIDRHLTYCTDHRPPFYIVVFKAEMPLCISEIYRKKITDISRTGEYESPAFKFAKDYTIYLSKKYMVKPPILIITDLPGAFCWGNQIHIPICVLKYWNIDRYKTEILLKSIVAHEFRHYLSYAKKIPIPYRKGRQASKIRKDIIEAQCRIFEFRETGVPYFKAIEYYEEILKSCGY